MFLCPADDPILVAKRGAFKGGLFVPGGVEGKIGMFLLGALDAREGTMVSLLVRCVGADIHLLRYGKLFLNASSRNGT